MGGQEQDVAAYFNQPIYLSKTFDIRLRHEIIQSLMPKALAGLRCLDVGCGDGSLSLAYLAELKSLTMVDLSEEMLKLAKNKVPPDLKAKVTMRQQAIDSIQTDNIQADNFDVILCIGVLAHVPDVSETLRSLAELLTFGGILIVQITDSDKWLSKLNLCYNHLLDLLIDRYGYKRNATSKSDILNMTQRLGLRLQEQRRFGLIAPGMQALISDELLFKYQRFVYRNQRLARWGTDVIFKFEKCDV